MPKNDVSVYDEKRVWRKFIALLAQKEPNHTWVLKQYEQDGKLIEAILNAKTE